MRTAASRVLCLSALIAGAVVACSSSTADRDVGEGAGSSAVAASSADDHTQSSGDTASLDVSFEASGWDYTVTGATVRDGDGVAFKVLDLTMAGTNNNAVIDLPGSLIFTVDVAGTQTTNCVTDERDGTPAGESVEFTVTCSLSTADDPTLDDVSVAIADVNQIVVATLDFP